MFDLLRLYAQVVEEQSFTVVARKLEISQPAVSNQMRALEEKLGVKLLYRKGKGFALTQEGEILYRHAKHILDAWADLIQEIGNSERVMSGKIHIGASHIPGEYLLPAYLASFRQLYPDITFKLTIGDSLEIAEKVVAHEVDFAVVGAVFDTEKLTSEYWLKDELVLLAAKDHPLCSEPSTNLRALQACPMVLRESGSGHRRAFEEALVKRGLDLNDFNVVLEVGSTEGVKNSVRSGLGYSFLSRHAIEHGEKFGLVEITVADFKLERGFYLLTRRNKSLPSIAEECYRYLLNQKPDQISE
ncbi:selenium metabolism-associated LysR family transcriptional regulator [Desulfosporosinus sp. PR]|uniref:selenium metabolism-associated LysR family transcriptional regulator n=1 Tax=Candidatus Desulfosporosinus nitrosoreducens TaxID=3401928 RepID=UPI0027FAE02B|nr:selenium metabolism-associated LysR family transcriptional regulator [Desulfosporosinus sp. PR]MDQ7093989.1 selenium metabolism-associated LysR family transcriptional regulator [Desulfosporosinus sp. PR]